MAQEIQLQLFSPPEEKIPDIILFWGNWIRVIEQDETFLLHTSLYTTQRYAQVYLYGEIEGTDYLIAHSIRELNYTKDEFNYYVEIPDVLEGSEGFLYIKGSYMAETKDIEEIFDILWKNRMLFYLAQKAALQ